MKHETKYFESLKGRQPNKLKVFWNDYHNQIVISLAVIGLLVFVILYIG